MIPSAKKRVQRIVLESTLKPFRELTEGAVREVCEELFRQWAPLIRYAEESAVLLWVGDGGEILTYAGESDRAFEWCRYIGFSNAEYPHAFEGPDSRASSKARLYTENPPEMTYRWLRTIVTTLQEVGRAVTGKPVSVGATFDPGPEFAHAPFRYERHTEILERGLKGREQKLQTVAAICAYSELNADADVYAGFPEGIPQGTPFGVFLGRQAQHFLTDMGFDYIWFSNGFGFSHFAWSGLGEAFDGDRFYPERARALAEQTLGFWKAFRAECPDFRVETRGTNFSTGMDLGSDGVPLEGIYQGGFNVVPPPNSPWGVLDGDFGLEMVGFMARMAHIPAEEFPFRYYTHDPWFNRSPWWDSYDREPYDIFCPLSVGRVTETGTVQTPTSIEFLSVDEAQGSYPEQCALEVVPQVLMATDHLPDAPGVLTWVYPFSEYHEMTYGEPSRIDEVYFGDWFVRNAINDGFPLNTVVSSENFIQAYGKAPERFSETVLFAPVPSRGAATVEPLCDFVSNGGQVLLYGPTTYADDRILEMLNITQADPINGELTLDWSGKLDHLETVGYAGQVNHRELTSAGGVAEVLADAADEQTTVCVAVSKGETKRVAALLRQVPAWKGGTVGWVRGTNPYSSASRPRLPVLDDPDDFFHGSTLLRYMLGQYGYEMTVRKADVHTRTPLWFVSRVNNGFFFTGYTPQTTVRSRFRFPWGAPLLIGWETRLEDGFSTYAFGRSYHEECRVFVDQAADTVISCQESPSRNEAVLRRILITGLENATVRLFRAADCLDRPVFIAPFTGGFIRGLEGDIAYKLEADGRQLVARGLSGGILISW